MSVCVWSKKFCVYTNRLIASIDVCVSVFVCVFMCVCVSYVWADMFKILYNFHYYQSIFRMIILFEKQLRPLLAKHFSLWLKSVYSKSSTLVLKINEASVRATREKGDWAVTDAQIRTLISHAKSPGTGPWTLDVPLTLGRLQTKEEKSTNQWAFSPTREGEKGV